MKIKYLLILCSFLIPIYSCYSQKLGLTDLTTICNYSDWTMANHYLQARGWEYFESEKGNSEKYNTITWTFNKTYYDDKAQGWFYMYTYEGYPNKLVYHVVNKLSYNIIYNNLSANGFKKTGSEIEDDEIIVSYANSGYILKVSTSKKEREEYYETSSLTAYTFYLIKKESIYDNDNGKKWLYYDDGEHVQLEYHLKNGEFHGEVKYFDENGNLKGLRTYVNGKLNGWQKEYDEDGLLSLEYQVKDSLYNGIFRAYHSNGKIKSIQYFSNDKRNGTCKWFYEDGTLETEFPAKNNLLEGILKNYYPNGKIKSIGTYSKNKLNGIEKYYSENGILLYEIAFKDSIYDGPCKIYHENGNVKLTGAYLKGEKNGLFQNFDEKGRITEMENYSGGLLEGRKTIYLYSDTENAIIEVTGNYKNNLEDGIWYTFLKNNAKIDTIAYMTLTSGIENGPFKEIQGDSTIFGTYKNGKMNGKYIIYYDFLNTFPAGDTAGHMLFEKGEYSEGKKNGFCTHFYLGMKSSEGFYYKDFKDGEWKYYYLNFADINGNTYPFVGKNYLTETYNLGILHGKKIRYSYLKEIEVPCDTIFNKRLNPMDTCILYELVKIHEESYYKDSILHGPYIYKDSFGNILEKGTYLNGKKDGEWLETEILEGFFGKDTSLLFYETGLYKEDLREGKWVGYFNGDFNVWECNYKKDKLDGEFRRYDYQKKLAELKIFENDKLVLLTEYDVYDEKAIRRYEILEQTDTQALIEYTFYGKEKTVSKIYRMKKRSPKISHFEFKNLFFEQSNSFKDGEECYTDGLYQELYPADDSKISGQMKRGKRIGLWIFEYPKINMKFEIDYNNPPYTEHYVFINSNEPYKGNFEFTDHENGILERRKIKDGLRNGTTITIDIKSKKTVKKENYKDGLLKE